MGVELPLRVVVTILECSVTFSGVKLSIRSFVLFQFILSVVLWLLKHKAEQQLHFTMMKSVALACKVLNSFI